MRVVSRPEILQQQAERAFKAAVLDVQREAMRNAPVRTGDLRRRVQAVFDSATRARVGLRHPGARIREFGGTIVAKRAAFLHFKTRDGRWVKVRSVTQRPGGYSQGHQPWLRPAGARFGEFFVNRLRAGR